MHLSIDQNPVRLESALPIQVRLVRDFAQLEPLAGRWDELLAQSATGSVFQTWRYTSLWWKHFGAQYQLCVLLAELPDGEVVGIAPLMIGRGMHGMRRQLKQLSFIASHGEAEGLYFDFLIREGMEREIASAFLAPESPVFRQDWDLLYISFLPSRSVSAMVLRQRLEKMGHLTEKTLEASPFIEFQPTWDEFLETKSPHFRRKIRKTLRDAATKLPGGEMSATPENLGAMYDALAEFNKTRWEAENEGLRTDAFYRFERELLESDHAAGELIFCGWQGEGKVAALNCAFRHGGVLWGYQMGWNPEFAKFSPGNLALAQVVKRGIEEKLAGLNMLSGASAYKESWANYSIELCRLEAPHPWSVRGRIFDFAATLKNRLARPAAA